LIKFDTIMDGVDPKGLPSRSHAVQSAYEFIHRLVQHIERKSLFALLVCSLIYLFLHVPIAQQKLFWDDEFFTLYIAGASSAAEMHSALMTGADQHPPLFYWITRGVTSVFGPSHVAYRAPALFGFWLMMVCLYWIVAKRTSPIYGLVAYFFPLITGMAYYATDARGYGLVLGFGALAFLCWLEAARGNRRALTLPLLWLCLALAVASHYYAILLLFPIGVGELVRHRFRAVDWAVSAAMTGAFVPLAMFHTTIAQAHTYSLHFWARPAWGMPLNFHAQLLRPAMVPLLAAGLVGFIYSWWLSRNSNEMQEEPVREPECAWQLHELIAVLALSFLPFVCILVSMYATQAYHPRYVISALTGATILTVAGFWTVFKGRRVGGMLLLILTLGWSARLAAGARHSIDRNVSDLSETARELETRVPASIPIVIYEVTVFHKLSYYMPRRLSRRLIYAADPARSVQYLKHDTIDRGLLALRPWFPIRVEPYESVIRQYPKYASIGYSGGWQWFTFALADDGVPSRLTGRLGDRILMEADSLGGVAPSISGDPLPSGRESAFLRFERDSTADDTTLCSTWTPDGNCGALISAGSVKK
jgi:hypothetical protein